MKVEPPYEVEIFNSDQIVGILENGALSSFEMNRFSKAPIEDEANMLTEPDSAWTTMPSTPTIEMRKTKIDLFRL